MAGRVRPPELHRFNGIEQLLTNVKDAISFWPQHPLVAVGRQGVDVRGSHIDGKNAHSLNRIHKEEAAVPLAELPESGQIDPVAAQVVHVADGEEPCAWNSLGDLLDGIVDG